MMTSDEVNGQSKVSELSAGGDSVETNVSGVEHAASIESGKQAIILPEKTETPEIVTPTPPPEKPKRKKILPIIIIAVILVSAIFLGYNESMLKKPEVESPDTAILRNVPVADIAGNSSVFLDSVEGGGKWEMCEGDKCEIIYRNLTLNQDLAWSILGYAGLYNLTGDVKYLDKINDTLRVLEANCGYLLDNQDVYWHSLPKGCQLLVMQSYRGYELTGDINHLKFVLSMGVPLSYAYASSDDVSLTSMYARELFIVYRLARDNTDVRKSIEVETMYMTPISRLDLNLSRLRYVADLKLIYPNEVKEDVGYMFSSPNGKRVSLNVCWVTLADLEAYEATKNESYVYNVKSFFDEYDFLNVKDLPELPPSTLLPCAESMFELYELTGEERYKLGGHDMLVKVLEENSNYAGGNLTGSFGSIMLFRPGSDVNVKNVADTSHFLYLVSKDPHKTYGVKRMS